MKSPLRISTCRIFCIAMFVAVLNIVVTPFSARSQTIPIKNAELNFSKPLAHGRSMVPTHWIADNSTKENVRAWNSPGSSAVALGGGAKLSQTIAVTPLNENLLKAGQWGLVFSMDTTGKFATSDNPAKISVVISDPDTKKVIAKNTFTVSNDAPISKVIPATISASSFEPGTDEKKAMDGNPNTFWHSAWKRRKPRHPHHLTINFGKPQTIRGFRYTPRKNLGNGTVENYQVLVKSGTSWKTVQSGKFSYTQSNKTQVVQFNAPVESSAIRLQTKSALGGHPAASCAEFVPVLNDGVEINKAKEKTAKANRMFLPLTVAQSKLKKLKVQISVDSMRFVIVDRVDLFWAPFRATKNMCGKPNGHLGPDLLGAGSFGFNGLMIHNYPALPIIEVHKLSPAAKAGLKNTDLIVGVNDHYFPKGDLAPGFNWVANSHEAILGNAALEAMEKNQGRLKLNILRQGREQHVTLRLNIPGDIANADFMTNPQTVEILNRDLIRHVLKHQKPDGSWRNSPIHTALGGLALLSTRNKAYAKQIKSAANWLLDKNAEPGTGWYWHPSFSGIFLCEYYLATGDKRVLPVIQRMLRMMSSAIYTSKWGTETFGHGPQDLPYGNKSLVAVMVHVLVFEALAKRCGVESTIFEKMEPFILAAWSDPAKGGHGGLGYNASYKDQAEFWSRTGLYMLALELRGGNSKLQKPMAEIMRSRYPWFRNSHAYGEPGGALGLIGLSQVNPTYFDDVLSKYRWWFALAWQAKHGLHFTIPHMGAPYMEGEPLINNAYGIVTNIHKKSLHITGSKQTNWLDVSKIPVPISNVLILQNKAGNVMLRCRIPGPEIYYTLDGSQPNRRSKKYTKPFEIQAGTTVRAIAVANGQLSQVATRQFWLNKSGWSIADASGYQDKNRAKQRAIFAIDGDQLVPWVTDVGEGAKGYPHQLVIDLGKPVQVSAAAIRFLFDGGTPSTISVSGSDSLNSGFRNLGEQQIQKHTARVEIPFSRKTKVRYLKFNFTKPLKQGALLLMVGEIDVR